MKKQIKPKASENTKRDVAVVCGRSDDGSGLNIIRQRNDSIETGVVKPLQEGKPIDGEVIELQPRGNTPVCDVKVHLPSPVTATAGVDGKGPPQVASERYRKNWDSIWKQPKQKKLLN